MTNYERFISQAQEGMQQAAKQLTETQDKAIAALKDAQGNVTSGIPSAARLVEANYEFTNRALQIQKDLTLRWVEAFASAEPNGKGGSRTGRVGGTATE